jgi:gamma-glutamylcyclotransferase (GGCT)/AIG2-like uncharacterized protein YtfP
MDYLFVYGTLLRHFDHKVLQPLQKFLQFEGNGSLHGELYNLGDYPGFVENANGFAGNVKGEVYLILNPDEVFAVLDEYEGEEYNREKKLVRLDTNKKIRCWVYVYRLKPTPEHEKIMSGDYIAFIRNKG